eukprot:scaffold277472_cov36-Prasinocladus_malaysianus.AAC.1
MWRRENSRRVRRVSAVSGVVGVKLGEEAAAGVLGSSSCARPWYRHQLDGGQTLPVSCGA